MTTEWSVAVAVAALVVFYFSRRNLQKKRWTFAADLSRDNDGQDVVIVGSGVLGSSMAAALARDGRRVTVIERSLAVPTRIVGEYLQPGGVRALKELGLEGCLGDFEKISSRGLRVFPAESGDAESRDITHLHYPSGHVALGFHHGRFVTSLRSLAQAEERCTYMEGNVVSLIEEDGTVKGVLFRRKGCDKDEAARAPLVILGDGSFSRLRKHVVRGVSQPMSKFIGLTHHGTLPGMEGYLNLILTQTTFVLVYQISETETRIMADISGSCQDVQDRLLELVPELPAAIRKSYEAAVLAGNMQTALTQSLTASASIRPGVIALGDAFNARHPVTGSGMSAALFDVIFWREKLREITDLRDYDAIMTAQRMFTRHRKLTYSFTLNIFANIMYATLNPKSDLERKMRSELFSYVRNGGSCHDDIADIFGTLKLRPRDLVWHLLAATVSAMVHVWRREKGMLGGALEAACVMYKAGARLLPLVWAELKTAVNFSD